MTIRSAYSPKERHTITFTGPGRTKQSMKAECDINNIMRQFQKTGVIDFVNKRAAQYGDATGVDFQKAMETVTKARELFAEMPSKLRKRFSNDPEEFLDFINDPDNRQEAIRLGLIKTERKSAPHTSDSNPKRREADSDEPQAKSSDVKAVKTD